MLTLKHEKKTIVYNAQFRFQEYNFQQTFLKCCCKQNNFKCTSKFKLELHVILKKDRQAE